MKTNFTPEFESCQSLIREEADHQHRALIEHPRRSPGVPNAAGSLVLHTVSAYNIETSRETKHVKLLDLETGQSRLLSNNPSESGHQWLGDSDDILYQVVTNGETHLWIRGSGAATRESFIGSIPSLVNDLKTTSLKNGDIGVAFTAPAAADGSLAKSEDADNKPREYDGKFVRVWNKWEPRLKSALFFTRIVVTGSSKKLEPQFKNALKGLGVSYPLISGETGSFAVSNRGILLSACESSVNLMNNLCKTVFFLKLDTFTEPDVELCKILVPEYSGSAYSPVFSRNGNHAAFLVSKSPTGRYNSENAIAIISLHSLPPKGRASLLRIRDIDKQADRLTWNTDGKGLYMQADDNGYSRVFYLEIPGQALNGYVCCDTRPERLATSYNVTSVSSLGTSSNGIFLSSSSVLDSSIYSVLDNGLERFLDSTDYNNTTFGLTRDQVSSEKYTSNGRAVQTWMIKPSFFDQDQKFPVIIMVHGGPQSAWNNAWSPRWNYAVFAEQGYIVLAPNITGSTGFGFEFLTEIEGDFGGQPYRDLEACYEWIAGLPFADSSRVSVVGGSYGGYMVNWIAGHDLGQKICAAVSHNGQFSMRSMMASDLTAYWDNAMGAEFWDDPKVWDKWSPSSYTERWKVPMLVIHSERDYRVTIDHGLAAYNLCQARGIPSRFLCFPDEGHWVVKCDNSLRCYKAVLGWLNYHSNISDGVMLQEVNHGFEAPGRS